MSEGSKFQEPLQLPNGINHSILLRRGQSTALQKTSFPGPHLFLVPKHHATVNQCYWVTKPIEQRSIWTTLLHTTKCIIVQHSKRSWILTLLKNYSSYKCTWFWIALKETSSQTHWTIFLFSPFETSFSAEVSVVCPQRFGSATSTYEPPTTADVGNRAPPTHASSARTKPMKVSRCRSRLAALTSSTQDDNAPSYGCVHDECQPHTLPGSYQTAPVPASVTNNEQQPDLIFDKEIWSQACPVLNQWWWPSTKLSVSLELIVNAICIIVWPLTQTLPRLMSWRTRC